MGKRGREGGETDIGDAVDGDDRFTKTDRASGSIHKNWAWGRIQN